MPPPTAAPAPEPFPGFTSEQSPTISGLSRTLSILAPLLVVLGVLRLGLGVMEAWKSSVVGGLMILPEGLLLAFAGLCLLAGANDAFYLNGVKGREKEHLTNTLKSINVAFTVLLILAGFIGLKAIISLFV